MQSPKCITDNYIGPQEELDQLTDEKIERLLLEAETRLRGLKSGSAVDLLNPKSNKAREEFEDTRIPKLSVDNCLVPYLEKQDNVASIDPSRVIDSNHGDDSRFLRPVSSLMPAHPKSKIARETAGPDWFNLPKVDLTPELRRDLQLLRMRPVLDPKRHYKKENGKAKPPEFLHVGTVIEGFTEFFSARIAHKDRKRTFVEETLATERETGRFKLKYNDIQLAKKSGKKSFYRNLKAQRNKKSN